LLPGDITVQQVGQGGNAEKKSREETRQGAGEEKTNHNERNGPDPEKGEEIGNIPDDRLTVFFGSDPRGSFHGKER
jgi:hypothetical protein